MKKIVFMYSGQGSQYYNMGLELYKNNNTFKYWMDFIDSKVKDLIGKSIIMHIYDENKSFSEPLDKLMFSHMGIFMIEFSISKALQEDGIKPDFVVGTSLGEFTAMILSNIFSLDDGIRMLIDQVRIIESHCSEGSMLTILSEPSLYTDEKILNENSEVVSINFETHFVISGGKEKINIIKSYLDKKSIVYFELPVKYGFHSYMLEETRGKLFGDSTCFTKNKPDIRYISSVTAEEMSEFDLDYIWHVARRKIEFAKAIQNLEEKGSYIYLDLGPGGTLANFAKRNINKNSKSEVYHTITPYGNDEINYMKLKETLERILIMDKGERGKMIAYVFPGQGSQYKGMGEELFDEFSYLIKEADEILGYSIKDLCMHDEGGRLSLTQYTQPALYIVNALTYLKKIKDSKVKATYVAGHSLGEYNALFAADVFDFGTGLKLVKKRGEIMSRMKKGTMAAIIGISKEEIDNILQENGFTSIDIANINTLTQTVIAGPEEDIQKAEHLFEDKGRYVILNVSGPFHSRYMKEASEEFSEYLEKFEFNEQKIPVISNVTARPHIKNEIKNNLVQQIVKPVNWTDSIRYIMGKDIKEIIQVGPGRVAQGLVDNILLTATPLLIEETVTSEEKEYCSKNIVLQETEQKTGLTGFSLGSAEFRNKYKVKYSYVTGGMYRGVSSKEMVVKLAREGILSFLGCGGLKTQIIKDGVKYIKGKLSNNETFGLNITHNSSQRSNDGEIINIAINNNIKVIEASAFLYITPELVKYRLKGIRKNANGRIMTENKIIAKLSRPEICELFISPPPIKIVNKLLEEGQITEEEAKYSCEISMAEDICVEADSGGHTDGAVAYAIVPTIIRQKNEAMNKFGYKNNIEIGVAGGIGTPEAAAASFLLGADFIVTGSINQCTVEAGTSDLVKDLLQDINVQDTEYAPAGDMFEIGSKVQVLKRGVLFPARANKLYDLYKNYNSIDEIDVKTKDQIEQKYLSKTFNEIFAELKTYYSSQEIERANQNPKVKMAMIFKWYYSFSSKWALLGDDKNKVNFQVHCGPALGAFNQWVKGTSLQGWRNREVDVIGKKLMEETALVLKDRLNKIMGIG